MTALVALPLFARKAIVDFVETGLAAIFTLNLVVPGDLNAAKAEGLVVGAAVAGALVSAARRALPGLYEYVRTILAVPSN